MRRAGPRARPMIGDSNTLRAPQAAHRERSRIDRRQAVIGARPDLPARVLEQLVDVLARESLPCAQADEVRSAVALAPVHDIDATAQGTDPEPSTSIGQERRNVTG